MADYREISQEYAKQGINAAFLINGGAAVALLSQIGDLRAAGLTGSLSTGMFLWASGTALAALTWVIAFMPTRLVDRSERELNREGELLKASNIFMYVGILSICISVALFFARCIIIGNAVAG